MGTSATYGFDSLILDQQFGYDPQMHHLWWSRSRTSTRPPARRLIDSATSR